MGSWDELCLLCGICPAGGPSALLHRNDLHDIACQLAADIRVDTLTDDDILSIVTDALSSSFSDDDRVLGYRPNWLPDGLGQRADLTQCTCIAIGYFDVDREGEAPIRDNGRVPDGRNVEVRRVRDIVGGDFRVVVRAIVDEDDEQKDSEALEMLEPEDQEELGDQEEWKEHEEDCDSACSVSEVNYPNNPNFWLCERCYRLLNAWLDKDALPCRNLALHSASEPMSLAGELYEIVNSRAQRRQGISQSIFLKDTLLKDRIIFSDADTGLLPCIDYDGIEATLEQWQVHFAPGRRGSRYIAKGIRAGLRGPDLIPAIMRDFRCWMFMQPDL